MLEEFLNFRSDFIYLKSRNKRYRFEGNFNVIIVYIRKIKLKRKFIYEVNLEVNNIKLDNKFDIIKVSDSGDKKLKDLLKTYLHLFE